MAVKHLIQKHGGTVKVAGMCGAKSPTVVSNWIRRDSIPVKYWPALIKSGFNSEDLLGVHKIATPLRAAE